MPDRNAVVLSPDNEVKVGEDLYPLSDETVVTTVARMFLDGPAKCPERASSTFGSRGRPASRILIFTIIGDQR